MRPRLNDPTYLKSQKEKSMIAIRNAGVTYPGGAVGLKPATIDFRAGKFMVLSGSSGVGKSTLLRLLNLLTRPSQGEIFSEVLGTLGYRPRRLEHRKQTAMIFQQHQLIRRYSACGTCCWED
jgi:phosphonate transport system ATP-binding protein